MFPPGRAHPPPVRRQRPTPVGEPAGEPAGQPACQPADGPATLAGADKRGHLPLGLAAVDEAMGGLPAGALAQLWGPSGAGKSTLALVIARANLPAALVLPEDPLIHRLGAIMGRDRAAHALVARPRGLDDQAEAVRRGAALLKAGRVRCVVLDSLTFHYRFERLSTPQALRELFVQLRELHTAARTSGGVAVFTNQVLDRDGGPTPVGGHAVAHVSDVVLSLAMMEGPWRRLRLEKHPTLGGGPSWDVRITDDGLTDR